MLKVVPEAALSSDTTAAGGSLLDELVRDGARQMLAAALQAEVAAYVEAHADQVDAGGRRLVVRNGSHGEREVTTAAGAVTVRAPRVNSTGANSSVPRASSSRADGGCLPSGALTLRETVTGSTTGTPVAAPELPSPTTGTGPASSVTPGPGRGRGRRWLEWSGARSRRRAG